MSHNEKNSNSVGTQQNQYQKGHDLDKVVLDPSNPDVVNNKNALQKRLTELFEEEESFSKWPAKKQTLAVSAASGLFTAILPLLAVGAILAIPGAIVGLALFFSVKAVQYGYKGLKWSAEKTVDGAKYTAEKVKHASTYAAGKVRDGAVHVRDSVKEAVSSVGRATREGTGTTLGKMGRSLSNLSESMSSLNAIPYSIGNEGQTVVLKTEEKTRNFNSVKEMFIKEVLEDKAVDNSVLIKKIFSELKGKILEKAYSVDGQSGFKKDQLINQLKQQVDFVNKLDAKKLQNLLSEDNNNLYEIFSDHHDEIKRIVGECKREYEFDQSVRRNNAKDVEERKASKSFSLPSFSLLGRKGSEQSNSLSRSNSLNSVRTDSTISSKAELLNPAEHKEVKAPSSFREKMPSWLGGKKAPEETTNVKYQDLSEPDTSSRRVGNSRFYVDTPTPIENTNKTATIGGRPGVARRGSTGNLTRVGTPEVPTRSASLTNLNGQSSFSEDVLSDPKVNQYLGNSNEGTLTRSNSFDSGRGSSGSSTLKRKSPFINLDPFGRVDSGDLPDPLIPKKLNLFQNNLSEARANLKETGYLNELVEQPSTKVAVDTDVQQQAAQTAVKTN